METQSPNTQSSSASSLETFLGGMETRPIPSFGSSRRPPLKPSLVEWKQEIVVMLDMIDNTLKPSLVEWKQEIVVMLDMIDNTLKPSLVEWKLAGEGHRYLRKARP